MSVLHWFHLNLHYATYLKQVLLQPDTSAELQMTGSGGAGRTRSRGPSVQQQLCGARQGEVGVSCLTVPHCGLSCSLQSSLQLHMRRSTSVTGRPGRESGSTTFVEYDLGLSSCYVRNSATGNGNSFQYNSRYTRYTVVSLTTTCYYCMECWIDRSVTLKCPRPGVEIPVVTSGRASLSLVDTMEIKPCISLTQQGSF